MAHKTNQTRLNPAKILHLFIIFVLISSWQSSRGSYALVYLLLIFLLALAVWLILGSSIGLWAPLVIGVLIVTNIIYEILGFTRKTAYVTVLATIGGFVAWVSLSSGVGLALGFLYGIFLVYLIYELAKNR
jgi:hypothetical protein